MSSSSSDSSSSSESSSPVSSSSASSSHSSNLSVWTSSASTSTGSASSSNSRPPSPLPFQFETNFWSPQSTPPSADDQTELELSDADQAKLRMRGYEIGDQLGYGWIAKVYHALFFKKACAVKVIESFMVAECAYQEVSMFKRVKHPHVVQLFDLFVSEQGDMLIFMELAEGGDLKSLLKKRKSWLSEKQASEYYLQFGDAFRYMHSIGIAHLDIKAANILLDQSKTVCKVADFGVSKLVYNEQTGSLLEELKLDPDSASSLSSPDNCINCKKDVYDTGIMLYNMLNYVQEKSGGGNPKAPTTYGGEIDRRTEFRNQSLSQEARHVIAVHLEPDSRARPSFEQILLNEVWFKIAILIPND